MCRSLMAKFGLTSATFSSNTISWHNLHSNIPYRLGTACALHSFCIQVSKHSVVELRDTDFHHLCLPTHWRTGTTGHIYALRRHCTVPFPLHVVMLAGISPWASPIFSQPSRTLHWSCHTPTANSLSSWDNMRARILVVIMLSLSLSYVPPNCCRW